MTRFRGHPIVGDIDPRKGVHDGQDAAGRLGLLGEFPLYVAAQMGHADANTTMRVYAKLLKEGVRLDREETLWGLHAAHRGEELPVANPVPNPWVCAGGN